MWEKPGCWAKKGSRGDGQSRGGMACSWTGGGSGGPLPEFLSGEGDWEGAFGLARLLSDEGILPYFTLTE